MTPEQYLPILLDKLGARLPEVKLSRRYVNGDAPLPEMGANLRESWEAFQKKARSNIGGRTIESLAGRIIPLSVRIGNAEAEAAARRFWRDNRLGVVFGKATWDALATGYGYVLTQVRDGVPIATHERPEQMITIPDPLQPWRSLAAVKAWRDPIEGKDYATVWVPGIEQQFVRDSANEHGTLQGLNQSGWEPRDPVEIDGGVPVQVFENEHGIGEVTPHRDLIDRINLGKLQRLSTVAMQAWRQRVIEGELPDEDMDGNAIDWAGAFEAAPGAIWEIPEGAKLTELSDGSAGIQAMLKGEEADVREYCGVTGTPMSNFLSDAQNQSAEGAMNAKEAEIAKAEKRIKLFSPAEEGVILDALRVYGMDPAESIEVQHAPTAYVSFQERAQAANLAKASGMPLRWIARHIWGRTAEEIAEIETDAALEQMSLFEAADGDAS